MKSLKFLICSVILVTGVACSSSANASKVSNKETRAKARTAYSELDEGSNQNATVNKKTTIKKTSVSNELPKPVIMVTPAQAGQDAKIAMDGVTEYLTKKGYDVRSQEGSSNLDNLIQMQNDIAGTEDDLSYLASLSLNADIYVKCTEIHSSQDQVIVELTAYESSTAKQLGSYSSSVNTHGRTSALDMKANLKTAAHKAMSGLEVSLTNYWQNDLKNGIQYKVVMNIKGEYGDSQLEDLQENIIANLKASFNKVKVNAMTAQTIDIVIYADPTKIDDAQSAYSEIRKLIKSLAESKKISVTKKLIIMDIK